MTRKAAWLSFGVVGLVAVSCTGAPENTEKTITIGAILDLTGDVAETGTEELRAVQLAFEQINAAGKVLDSKLVLDNRDPGWDTEKVKKHANDLADAKVPFIVGPTASKLSLAGAEVAASRKLTMIAGWPTSPALTTFADEGYFFRTIPSDALQGKVVAQRAYNDKGFRTAAVIYAPHAYGEGLSATFREAFTALGGTITQSVAYSEDEGTDYTALVNSVLTDDPDTIVLIAYAVTGAKILRAYVDNYSATGKFWYLTDGCAGQDFVDLVEAQRFVGLRHEGTTPATPVGSNATAFNDAFKAKHGVDPLPGSTGAIQAYDAVYLGVLAMAAAGSTDSTAIRDKLAAVSGPPGEKFTPSQFSQALDAIKAGQDIDFEGASGAVDFDDKGDVVGPYCIWEVQNGTVTCLRNDYNP
ncbi:MAG: ABC transporter substrate-binding protein [Myxococcota bacterium]